MAISKLFQTEVGNGDPMTKLLKPLFAAWVKNKLVPIHFMLQKPEIDRPRARIEAAISAVHELCGHFCYDDDYEHYFFHLISVLEKLPHVTKRDCQRGIEDLEAILRLFGIQWKGAGDGEGKAQTSD